MITWYVLRYLDLVGDMHMCSEEGKIKSKQKVSCLSPIKIKVPKMGIAKNSLRLPFILAALKFRSPFSAEKIACFFPNLGVWLLTNDCRNPPRSLSFFRKKDIDKNNSFLGRDYYTEAEEKPWEFFFRIIFPFICTNCSNFWIWPVKPGRHYSVVKVCKSHFYGLKIPECATEKEINFDPCLLSSVFRGDHFVLRTTTICMLAFWLTSQANNI